MSPEILIILFVFLLFLLISSIGMSLYLLYDMRSGNYRKFLSAGEKHTELSEEVHKVLKKNLGES